MSERNHSRSTVAQSPNQNPASKRKLLHIIGGTTCLMLITAVVFQYLRAEPAQSQTQPQSTQSSAAAEAQFYARVNNQPITYDQVARECVTRHGVEVLDSMINRLIIQQECEKRGIAVKESEIEQEVVEIAGKFNLPIDAWYQMLKAERDITPDQYHRDIIWPMLALKKLAGRDIKVTEQDMRIAFERDYGPRVKGRLILIDGNLRRATDVWNECQQKPDEFDSLAQKYSADPNSRPLGGVVPAIRRHSWPPNQKQIEEAVFKLRPGEISPVLQTEENRYMIFKCEGHTDPVVTDIKDVWTDLHATLVEEKTQQAVASIFEELKGQAQVINYLTRESTVGSRSGPAGRGAIQQTSGQAPASQTR